MTHDEWWETQDLSKADVPKALMLAFKEVSERAWDASRNCPTCGRDLKLKYCPNGCKECKVFKW
ncbi:MAG: hypothetical protein KKE05_07060 [Nanoarchaeota archaeon]|nr:hypothetical protein [Nanoarchaeota archaeon]